MIRGPRHLLPLAVGILAACGGEAPTPGLANGSFTAELDGVRIHYAVHGAGPVLMTVPNSWGLSHGALRADFHALREHLGLETVHAIGWSNGAANLIYLAHERPATLESADGARGFGRAGGSGDAVRWRAP